jgi:hypothetical protein
VTGAFLFCKLVAEDRMSHPKQKDAKPSGISTPAEYLGHCASLWMEDFFGDDPHPSGEEIDPLVALLKAGRAAPVEKPWVWVWDEVKDEFGEDDPEDDPNLPAEVLEITEVLCHGDMTLAIEILNEYKTITQC